MQEQLTATITDGNRNVQIKLEPNEALLRALHENADGLKGLRDGIRESVAEVKSLETKSICQACYWSGARDGAMGAGLGALLVLVVLLRILR